VKGNILSLVNRYQEANQQYEKCLEIIQSFQANRLIDINEEKGKEKATNVNSTIQFKEYLIQIYYNYGISLIHSSSERDLVATNQDGTTTQGSVVSNPPTTTAVHNMKEKGEKLLREALSLLQPQNNPEEGGEMELDSNHRVIVERISHFLNLSKS
jgi:tetratricopeptide (TPR) repeat protein